MKHFLAILITLMLFALHFLPAYMIAISNSDYGPNPWGIMYVPLIALDCLWGNILNKHYFEK